MRRTKHPDIIANGINFTQRLQSEGDDFVDLSDTQQLIYNPTKESGFIYDYSTKEFLLVEGEELKRAIEYAKTIRKEGDENE